MTYAVDDAAAMEALGARLGTRLPGGTLVRLIGELGAGKTTLVRGIARGVGCTDPVRSPTFGLVHRYEGGRFLLWHVDLYRLAQGASIDDLGVEFWTDDDAVCCVEWPERCEASLPEGGIVIHIDMPEEGRTVSVIGVGSLSRVGEDLQ